MIQGRPARGGAKTRMDPGALALPRIRSGKPDGVCLIAVAGAFGLALPGRATPGMSTRLMLIGDGTPEGAGAIPDGAGRKRGGRPKIPRARSQDSRKPDLFAQTQMGRVDRERASGNSSPLHISWSAGGRWEGCRSLSRCSPKIINTWALGGRLARKPAILSGTGAGARMGLRVVAGRRAGKGQKTRDAFIGLERHRSGRRGWGLNHEQHHDF